MSTTESTDSPQARDDPTQTQRTRARVTTQLETATDVTAQEAESQLDSGTSTAAVAAAGLGVGIGGLAAIRSPGAFRSWLTRLFDALVLNPADLQTVRSGQHWLAASIREGYETGLRQSLAALRAQGYDIGDRPAAARIADPIHQQALARLYEEAYLDLDEALANAVTEISGDVREGGYLDRDGDVDRAELGAFVRERIQANYGKRISPLADSVPVRAANQAALVEYQRAGVSEVGVEPEASNAVGEVSWQHANDGNVCGECLALAAGGPYPLSDVLAGNPEPPPSPHLRCRCFLFPI